MNDLWQTRPQDFKWIQSQLSFRMIVDLAADQFNSKCPVFISEKENALNLNWWDCFNITYINLNIITKVFECGAFCNPPYSKPNLPRFTEKACIEALKGLNQCFILPLDVTGWSRDYVWGQSEVWIPDERMKFIDPSTGEVGESPAKGSMIVIYGPLAKEGVIKSVHIPDSNEAKPMPIITYFCDTCHKEPLYLKNGKCSKCGSEVVKVRKDIKPDQPNG